MPGKREGSRRLWIAWAGIGYSRSMSTSTAGTDALFTDGKRLMAEGQTEAGFTRLVEAAHGGHAEASHLVAMLVAADPSVPDQWQVALAYVGRAAKAGHRRARQTLALLAGDQAALAAIDRDEDLPMEAWHRLHDAITPDDWLRPLQPRVMRESPSIAVIDTLLPPALCGWIVRHAAPNLKRAQVYNGHDASAANSGQRTNSDMHFVFPDTDLALMFLARRICDHVGCDFHSLEDPSVLHYRPGQQFRRHFDYLDPAVPAFAQSLKKQGQRVWTLLVYLNDDYDGGETEFPLLKLKYKGGTGDALLFRNVDPAGAPDPNTLHAGLAPASGEKWLFSQWIRQRNRPG
jgi:hypothetical protein